MVWTRYGSCNRCGDCCKPPEMACPWMTDQQKGYCKHLSKIRGKWTCAITGGLIDENPGEKPDGIPQEDWDYYLAECAPYPTAERTVETGREPLPACGYYFEET